MVVLMQIKSLNLDYNKIGDEGIAHLKDVLKKLEILDLSSCKITADGAKLLADCMKENNNVSFMMY